MVFVTLTMGFVKQSDSAPLLSTFWIFFSPQRGEKIFHFRHTSSVSVV